MIVDTESNEMQWMLLKFLKDSLEFLTSGAAKGVKRKDWVKAWILLNLTEEQTAKWVPYENP